MLAEKNCKNIAVWQIDSQKKLFSEIDKNPDRVLKMILDMCTIYIKYLNQTNTANK